MGVKACIYYKTRQGERQRILILYKYMMEPKRMERTSTAFLKFERAERVWGQIFKKVMR